MTLRLIDFLVRRAQKALKLFRLLKRAEYRRGMRFGVGASIEHRPAFDGLSVATAVDVGANKGQFTLFLVEAFPEAHIFAFEPLPLPAARFQKVFLGYDRVVLYETAIGPTDGEMAIHVSRRDDSSSLLPITSLQSTIFPGTELKEMRTVKVTPLNRFLTTGQLQSPALLKLDVQGYELEALRGCDSLLSHFAYVYAECSFLELYAGQALAHEIIDYLRSRGFHLTGIYNLGYDRTGHAVQADFLFKSDA